MGHISSYTYLEFTHLSSYDYKHEFEITTEFEVYIYIWFLLKPRGRQRLCRWPQDMVHNRKCLRPIHLQVLGNYVQLVPGQLIKGERKVLQWSRHGNPRIEWMQLCSKIPAPIKSDGRSNGFNSHMASWPPGSDSDPILNILLFFVFTFFTEFSRSSPTFSRSIHVFSR